MIINPEIQKYKWLELSQHRLIVMPVVLVMLFFLASKANSPEIIISNMAITIFIALVGVWGGGKVLESVVEEANDNTWDFQRLSALSPSSLAFGKLIGSPIYCWYGGAMLIITYIISSLEFLPTYIVFCNMMLLILGGLICHAGALLSSLQSLQSFINKRSKMGRFGHFVVGIALSLPFCLMPLAARFNVEKLIYWYSYEFESTGFTVVFAIIILFWLLVGIYWQMRKQLQVRNTPTAWTSFVIFTMFFCSGFVYGNDLWTKYNDNIAISLASLASLSIAFIIGVILTYIMVFFENWNCISYKRLLDCWKSGNKKKFYEIFPRWLITFFITILIGSDIILSYSSHSQIIISFTIISVVCFVIRDIAILHYFKLSSNNKRYSKTTIFYLLLLYVLLPNILNVLQLHGLIALFQPFPSSSQDPLIVNIISGAVQAVFVSVLAFKRWKKSILIK